MRGVFIIGFAVIIDFVQGMLGLSALALQVLPFVGQMAATIAAVLAEVIGFTFGAALILTLVFTGTFSWGAVMGGSLAEMIPLLDMLIPGWTLMALRCMHNKKMEERARRKAQVTQSSLPAPAAPARAFDGIRAANDNNLYEAQLAA